MNLLDSSFQTIVDEWSRSPPADIEQNGLNSIMGLGNEQILTDSTNTLSGVELNPDFDVNNLYVGIHRLQLIRLVFPNFADGRAYSQARTLRQQFRYTGEIRASGQVLIDQLDFMQRCGFSQFELNDDEYETMLSRQKNINPEVPLTTPALLP